MSIRSAALVSIVAALALAVPGQADDGWVTKTERLPDGRESIVVSVRSGPTFDRYGQPDRVTLSVRSRPQGVEVLLTAPTFVGKGVMAGFDDEPPTRIAVVDRSKDNQTLFLGSPTELLKRFLRHRTARMVIEMGGNFAPADVTFPLAGLSAVVGPLLAAAGLPADLATQPLRPGKWLLEGEESPTPSVSLLSENQVPVGATSERAQLVLFCRDRKLEAYVITADTVSKSEAWVEIDGGKRRKHAMVWSRPQLVTRGKVLSLFFPDGREMFDALLAASRMTVTLGRSDGPSATFDVAHLQEYAGPLRTACRIK